LFRPATTFESMVARRAGTAVAAQFDSPSDRVCFGRRRRRTSNRHELPAATATGSGAQVPIGLGPDGGELVAKRSPVRTGGCVSGAFGSKSLTFVGNDNVARHTHTPTSSASCCRRRRDQTPLILLQPSRRARQNDCLPAGRERERASQARRPLGAGKERAQWWPAVARNE
jgi:hypothetical protein